MMGMVFSAAAGFLIGATLFGVLVTLRIHRHVCPDPEAHGLNHADRDEISAEFAAHAMSVRRELSRYADELADGDAQLRDRLRQVEAGARS